VKIGPGKNFQPHLKPASDVRNRLLFAASSAVLHVI
jgi:hypothetical protein